MWYWLQIWEILDERKNQQMQVHPLTPLYTYCHMQLKCDYFGHIEGKWCATMCPNIYCLKYDDDDDYYYYYEIIWDV